MTYSHTLLQKTKCGYTILHLNPNNKVCPGVHLGKHHPKKRKSYCLSGRWWEQSFGTREYSALQVHARPKVQWLTAQLIRIPSRSCELPLGVKCQIWGFTTNNNTYSFSTNATQNFLAKFKWQIFQHPQYLPDLASSDYHLFPKLKHHLGGMWITNDVDLQIEVSVPCLGWRLC